MPTFDTPEPITVMIEVPLGDVHLIAAERTDTVVVVNPSDRSRNLDVEAAEKTQVDFSGGRLLVKTPKPRGIGNYIGVGRPGSVDITIELPESSTIAAETGFADLRVDGRIGDTRIESGAGDIRLDESGRSHLTTGAGNVTVNRTSGRTEITGAGEMRIGEIDGEAEIKNMNGKTWVGEVTGGVRVKSANGDITIDRARAEVAVKTANGSIRIGEVARGAIVLETGSGGLDVGIGTGTGAFVDARTRFGRVHNALESVDGPETSQETVEIHARTSFGDIVIHRS
jgi:DUF4097 and DUF4098 domain-containing protein YvlB